MKYIIMCGGEYPKWETPRQLLKINGETIVERTIRLLRENGIEDIAISSNNDVFERFGVPVLRHTNGYKGIQYNVCEGIWCDAFYPTNEPTCYLFGDVVYSPKAIKTIVEYETDDIMFFGSSHPFAPEYPKWYIEPFCFKVQNTEHLHKAVEDVKRLYREGRFGRQPIAWEVWNVISRGADGDVNYIDERSYVGINDYTCDIDAPNETDMLKHFANKSSQ